MHPAQALLHIFREPQFNYLEVQSLLDDPAHQSSVLLSDLAKAFEGVNPHWIMHVLFVRGAPYWVLSYCRRILFGRRVLHKIKSSFRPPLAIHNGVDMGRAFSVLLFCVAMDPWYHHVHKIPQLIGATWMIMPLEATDSSGSLGLNSSFNPSPPLDLWALLLRCWCSGYPTQWDPFCLWMPSRHPWVLIPPWNSSSSSALRTLTP